MSLANISRKYGISKILHEFCPVCEHRVHVHVYGQENVSMCKVGKFGLRPISRMALVSDIEITFAHGTLLQMAFYTVYSVSNFKKILTKYK